MSGDSELCTDCGLYGLMSGDSELCTDCGLCCDGALFSSVSLDAAAVATARQHHFAVLETPDAIKLELPCPALRGVLCEIYDDRPECCADYVCALLARVDEQRLSLEDAREIIKTTRSIRSKVAASVGSTPWWVAHHSAIEAERSHPTWAHDHAELLTDLKELERLIRRHFWS